MPLLQVRDFPQNYYDRLTVISQQENRSITQQTIFMLKTQLDSYQKINASKRKDALSKVLSLNLELPVKAPSAVDLIREDRDR